MTHLKTLAEVQIKVKATLKAQMRCFLLVFGSAIIATRKCMTHWILDVAHNALPRGAASL